MSTFFAKLKELRLVQGIVYALVGAFTYPGINLINKLQIKGMNNLHKLPKQNVLFVSNHQTYFAEVITFIHIFCAVRWRKKYRLGIPYYLLWPFTKVKYVAAEETMKQNWLSKLFSLAGAITVKRTWCKDAKEVRKNLNPGDTRKIERALQHNWVITFPQGTTKPFAPGRKGTAFIIKHHRPIVIPVVINGFWRAFNKKGLKFKKKGSILSVTFKDPLVIDYNDSLENILEQVMDAIEQSKKYMLQSRHHTITVLDKITT
ncbi:MAG: lysophospholipid acyltransferase family protein [Ferruginibacter sp.]